MFVSLLSPLFDQHQNWLWLVTVTCDLGFAVLLFRLFGRQGLYASIIISLLLANLQGPKLTVVFGMQTSMGVVVYSSIFFATDLLSERYGKREANRAVMIGFFVSILIIVMISLSLLYQPSTRPETADYARRVHDATQALFNYTPRFVLGSLLAYYISQRLDVFLFHWIKQRTDGKHLWLRNNGSTLISQAVDTVTYGIVVWWGLVDLLTAMQLALAKYVFKVAIALIDTPFIYMARDWDVSDRDWTEQEADRSTGHG